MLSAVELVKTKKGGKEKPTKKLRLQQGAWEEAHVHRAAIALAPKAASRPKTVSTGMNLRIVCPHRSFSTHAEGEYPEMEEDIGYQDKDSVLHTSYSVLPPNFFELIKRTMRNEIVDFCKEGFFCPEGGFCPPFPHLTIFLRGLELQIPLKGLPRLKGGGKCLLMLRMIPQILL